MRAIAMDRVVLVSALALGAAACSDAGLAESEGAASSSVLAPGDRGPEVRAARAYFESFGYFENEELAARHPDWRPILGRAEDAPDVYGEELRLAVNFFQTRSGLPVTGNIDEPTRAVMEQARCGNPDSLGMLVDDKWSRLPSGALIPDNRHTGGSSWTVVDGAGYRLDVAPDGTPWLVTAAGGIWRRTGVSSSVPNGTGWTNLDGPAAADIAVGREGAVWITDKSGRIHLRHEQPAVDNSNPANGRTTDPEDIPAIATWAEVDGRGTNVSVGMRSLPWVTGPDLSLWRRYGG